MPKICLIQLSDNIEITINPWPTSVQVICQKGTSTATSLFCELDSIMLIENIVFSNTTAGDPTKQNTS
jgi:hypothetical protein